MPLLFAYLSFAAGASLRSWLDDEIDDGLAYGREARLRRWTVGSFFSARLRKTAMLEDGVSDRADESMTTKAL
jgi:hypothetical protein